MQLFAAIGLYYLMSAFFCVFGFTLSLVIAVIWAFLIYPLTETQHQRDTPPREHGPHG